MVFNYVSTDVRTFPAADRAAASKIPATLLGVVGDVGASFYDSARAKNLLYVAEEDPEFFERLVIPERHLPAASSPLGAFFGFFETGLREFDFALGMYDARRMAEVRLAARLSRAGQPGKFQLPDKLPGAAASAASWQPYRCLSAVLDDPPAAEAACQGDALRDFRIVLQASIERLWDRCASLQELKGVFADDPLCRAAAEGQPPRQVPGVTPLGGDAWRRAQKENETGYTMRLLAAHQFEFKDLGLEREQAAEAPARLRERLLEVGHQVAQTQPTGQGAVVETAVKLAADQVVYVPPRFTGWVVVGSDSEIGLSQGFRSGLFGVAAVRLPRRAGAHQHGPPHLQRVGRRGPGPAARHRDPAGRLVQHHAAAQHRRPRRLPLLLPGRVEHRVLPDADLGHHRHLLPLDRRRRRGRHGAGAGPAPGLASTTTRPPRRERVLVGGEPQPRPPVPLLRPSTVRKPPCPPSSAPPPSPRSRCSAGCAHWPATPKLEKAGAPGYRLAECRPPASRTTCWSSWPSPAAACAPRRWATASLEELRRTEVTVRREPRGGCSTRST